MIRVTFLPDGKHADVDAGTSVVDASVAAGVRFVAPCNGKGTCCKCGVQFEQGAPEPSAADARAYSRAELDGGWRLACMHRLVRHAVVLAAPATLGKVDFGPSLEGTVLDPAVRKVYIAPGALRGEVWTWADLQARAQGHIDETPTLAALRQLGSLDPAPESEATAVCRAGSAFSVEAGDTRLETFGLAVDVGTTTVAASLLDLATGEERARASALNRQSVHGSDVMSRLTALQEQPQLLPVLQRLAVETINELVASLCADAGVARDRIYETVVAGNSAMHHVLFGIDPASLALAPYDARVVAPIEARAGDLELDLEPATAVCGLPNVASFIGGDALGAALAVGLHRSETIKCLVDIGTNGEILLGSRDRIVACSTPAGPAFEGGSISCGTIASRGAIEKVRISDTVEFETVGGAQPRGIAGSALIDLLAELRRAGLLSEQGKFIDPPPGVAADVAARFDSASRSFLVARSLGRETRLTQRDVRELQLAKGVIHAGILALATELGIEVDAIDEIYLAGTFGSYLGIPNARAIGLVPAVPLERIRAVGNAALVGVKMCLLSVDARREAVALARRIEHVELPRRKDFQDLFMDAMLFPAMEGTAHG